ncbi:MAG: DUF2281 domain-containing protein [Caldilineaceae bacterium]|nr:DUF2281 domain-containing protein [Caldilineaceae bacterium]
MHQVTYSELEEHLVELLEQVIRGQEVVIVKDDQPVAKLTPMGSKKERVFGSAKDLLVYMADDFDEPLEDFKEYME